MPPERSSYPKRIFLTPQITGGCWYNGFIDPAWERVTTNPIAVAYVQEPVWQTGPVPGNTRVLVRIGLGVTIGQFVRNPGRWIADDDDRILNVDAWMPLPEAK